MPRPSIDKQTFAHKSNASHNIFYCLCFIYFVMCVAENIGNNGNGALGPTEQWEKIWKQISITDD